MGFEEFGTLAKWVAFFTDYKSQSSQTFESVWPDVAGRPKSSMDLVNPKIQPFSAFSGLP